MDDEVIRAAVRTVGEDEVGHAGDRHTENQENHPRDHRQAGVRLIEAHPPEE